MPGATQPLLPRYALHMVLSEATWQEVRDFSPEAVCLIPTGALEQHGPHLPLSTDTILSAHVAGEVEKRRRDATVLYPGIWLGCSSHHMAMSGSATASAHTYIAVLSEVIESAIHHGFTKLFVLNGHGGNTEPNGVALRELKDIYPDITFAHCGYFSLIPQAELEELMEGPIKGIRHSCEAEVSMMMHVRSDLVRTKMIRNDAMQMIPQPPAGLQYIQPFHEITEEGSFGYAKLATAEKGRKLIEMAIEGSVKSLDHIHGGYVMESVIETP